MTRRTVHDLQLLSTLLISTFAFGKEILCEKTTVKIQTNSSNQLTGTTTAWCTWTMSERWVGCLASIFLYLRINAIMCKLQIPVSWVKKEESMNAHVQLQNLQSTKWQFQIHFLLAKKGKMPCANCKLCNPQLTISAFWNESTFSS